MCMFTLPVMPFRPGTYFFWLQNVARVALVWKKKKKQSLSEVANGQQKFPPWRYLASHSMQPPSIAACLLFFLPSDLLALDEMCCNQARREWLAEEKFGKGQQLTVCSHQILFHHTSWFLARAFLCGVFAWVSSVHYSFACTFSELETDVRSYQRCSFQLPELLHRSGSLALDKC